MSNASDFRIKNGVLTRYVGPGGDVIIPEGVTSIEFGAFYGCDSLKSITIPESVTSIGSGAFHFCSSLTSVTLPDGVTSIEDMAFSNCRSLTSITIPEGVTSIGSKAFESCRSLASITLPKGVTSIGREAFNWCRSLASITLPEGVTTIGDRAFNDCSSLTSIMLPAGVTSIGEGAFCGCIGLADAEGLVIVKGVLYSYHGQGGDVVVPNGVTRIEDGAFAGSIFKPGKVTSITIPDSVISIGSGVFAYTPLLENKTNWNNDVLYLGHCLIKAEKEISGAFAIKEGTRCIAGGAFGGCEGLTEISIPDSVISIGDSAFSDCTGLSGISIPESVKMIGSGAFSGCKELSRIHIPKNVVCIGKRAFTGSITILDIDADQLELPEGKLSAFVAAPSDELTVFAPNLSFASLRRHGLGMAAVKPFLSDHTRYTDPAVIAEYLDFIASQRKKLLPEILHRDTVDLLRMLTEAGKITKKNAESDYLQPAKQCKAEKCIAYLESVFGGAAAKSVTETATKKTEGKKQVKERSLWDGIHFSLDGKKLLKYPEEPGRTRYEVPKGTVEICKEAFFMTALTEVVIPNSVTTVRNGAFTAKSGEPLFIRLPRSLKVLPSEAFVGGSFVEDMDIEDDTKYYYVSSPVKTLADDLCLNSYKKGCRCMVYTGGPLDDLYPTLKKFAVQGFLYATQHDLEDLSKWRGSYLDHIKRNEKTYLKQALSDAFLLNLMLEESLLSAKGTKTLLNEAEANGRTDLTAALLEYRQKHFGDKSNDALSLSDDDPEFKRMQKMAARREAIKDQKGIKGIVFVQTGDMTYFGYYDEYTGAKDMTDLKDFIEARGGFLRSAVSSNTDYLICNDPNSDTVKSKKAKELGVPIITEDQFLKMAEEKE